MIKNHNDLIHYIIVRRDLGSFGTTLAMVGHAAADSMESWRGSWFRYKRKHPPITLVVLGVEDFKGIMKARLKLSEAGIPHVSVHDTYDGADHVSLLAVGVEPGARESLSPILKNYTIWKPKQDFPVKEPEVKE